MRERLATPAAGRRPAPRAGACFAAAAAVSALGVALFTLRGLAVGASPGPLLASIVRWGVPAQATAVALAATAVGLAALPGASVLAPLVGGVVRAPAIVAATLGRALPAALGTAAGSALPLAAAAVGAGLVGPLARAQLAVAATSAALAALGLAVAVWVRRRSSAAAAAYALVLAAIAAPWFAGFALGERPGARRPIEAALLASPTVAAASALGVDLMRTEILYRVSPVGQRRYSTPSLGGALVFSGGILVTSLLAASGRLAGGRRHHRWWKGDG